MSGDRTADLTRWGLRGVVLALAGLVLGQLPLRTAAAEGATATELAEALFPGATVLAAGWETTSGGSSVASPGSAQVIPGGVLLSTGLAADGGTGSTDLAGDGNPDRTAFSVTLEVPSNQNALVYTSAFLSAEVAEASPNGDAATLDASTGLALTLAQVTASGQSFKAQVRAVDVSSVSEITLTFSIADVTDGHLDSGIELTNGFFTASRIATAEMLVDALLPDAAVTSPTLTAESGFLEIVDVVGAAANPATGTILLTTGLAGDKGLGDHDVGNDATEDATSFGFTLEVPEKVGNKTVQSLIYTTRFTTSDVEHPASGADQATAFVGSTDTDLGNTGSLPTVRAVDVKGESSVTLTFDITDAADQGAVDSGLLVYGVYFSPIPASQLLNRAPDARMRTGTYSYSKSLIVAHGAMQPFAFMIHYNSGERRTSGAMGPRWGHSYDWGLTRADGKLLVRRGDGVIETFENDPNDRNAYVPAHGGIFSKLGRGGPGYEYRTPDQLVYSFDSGQSSDVFPLVAITDENGNQTVLTHEDDLLATVTDTRRQVATFSYDGEGRLTSVVYADVDGNPIQSASMVYHEYDNLTSVTGPDGKETTYGYAGETHNLTTIRDATGTTTVRITYDEFQRVTHQLDANINEVKTSYATSTSEHTDAVGNVTVTAVDALDRPVSIKGGTGALTRYGYDPDDNVTSQTDPLDRTSFAAFDERGNETSSTDVFSDVSLTEYDQFNRPTLSVDPLGSTLHFIYDEKGNLVEQIDQLGNSQHYEYDDRGLPIRWQDANGNRHTQSYNATGDATRIVDPLGRETHYEYDVLGREVAAVDPAGSRTELELDAYGRVTKTIDALGSEHSQTYDAEGRLTSETDALGRTSYFEYWPTGKLKRFTDALGHSTTRTYDGNNQLASTADPLGNTAQHEYDVAQRLTKTTDALGCEATIQYDIVGNITAVQDPNGNRMTFGYDSVGNVVSETDALGNAAANTFDARGLVSTIKNARGRALACEYDDAGRLTTVRRSDYDVAFVLDANGNRTQTIGKDGRKSSRTYDALNRVTSATDVHGKTIRYAYDAVGNLASITYSDGAVVRYTYDALYRMTSVTDWAGRKTSYEWDALGKLIKTTLPDSSIVRYSYDTAGRMVSVEDTAPSSEKTFRTQFTLGPSGLRDVEVSELPLEAPFTSDVKTFLYDAANQLISDGVETFEYDADGNMVHGVVGRLPVDLEFDDMSRLVEVGASQYEYDDEGLRVQATINHKTVRYVQDTVAGMSRVIEEHDAQGRVIARYVYGLGLISRHQGSGSGESSAVYHYDSRGSTLALTDLGGRITDRYAYDPYGAVVAREGRSPNPFTYNGRDGVMDDGNGLYFMRSRYYEPRLMRFVSRDRVVSGMLDDTQSLNRYMFVRGNPIHGIDPSGQWFWVDDAMMAFGGAVANVAGQLVSDLVSGETSEWEDYVGAAVGGAVYGEMLLYTGSPIAAGLAGAAAQNATTQGLRIASGKQTAFDWESFGVDTAVGGALGALSVGIFGKASQQALKQGARGAARDIAYKNAIKPGPWRGAANITRKQMQAHRARAAAKIAVNNTKKLVKQDFVWTVPLRALGGALRGGVKDSARFPGTLKDKGLSLYAGMTAGK